MKLTQEKVNELFSKEYSALVTRMLQVLKRPEDAEDMAQEAFIKLSLKAAEGYEVNYPRAFLYRVAHNMALDYLRKRNREDSRILATEADVSEVESSAVVEQWPMTGGLEGQLDNERALTQVFNSLSVLPGKCQEVFINHKVHQFSYRETANHMGLSVSMVEKYMSKALKHVRSDPRLLQQAA